MARLTLSGGKIEVRFADGKKRKTGVAITSAMNISMIKLNITLALNNAKINELSNPGHVRQIDALRPKVGRLAKYLKGLAGRKRRARPRRVRRRTTKPRTPKPAPGLKRVTKPHIVKALYGDAKTIELVARNKESLSIYISANRSSLTKSLFRTMKDIMSNKAEFDFEGEVAAARPDLFENTTLDDLTGPEKIAAIRYFLYEFIPYGNPEFSKELFQLNNPKATKGPLDADILIAAAAYLRRWKAEKRKAGAGKSLKALNFQVSGKKVFFKVPVVACIGASTTAEKIGQKIGYVAALEKKLRTISKAAVVDAYGIMGESTSAILKRFRSNISKRNYNTIVLQGGINDSVAYKSDKSKSKQIVDKAAANFTLMIRMARSKGMNVILFTIHPHKYPTPEVGKRIDAINKWMLTQGKRLGATVIKVPRLDKAGSLHPAMKDRAVIAELIFKSAFTRKVLTAPVTKVSQEQAYKIAQNVRALLVKFISRSDPLGLMNYEKGLPKDMISTIPAGHAEIKSNALYLAAQVAFNKLKDNDPGFNRFLIKRKSKMHEFLVDLPNRKVRMHTREVDTFETIRGGRSTKTNKDQISRYMVANMQEYLSTQYNQDTKVKGDFNQLYGKGKPGGAKRPFSKNGTPNRSFFYELSAYFWRLKNKYEPPAAWIKKIAPKKRQMSLPR
jgi:hypothetical protein